MPVDDDEDVVEGGEAEDPIVQAELAAARGKRRQGGMRIAGIAVSVLVVAAVFVFALPRIADYRDVWDVVQTMSAQSIAALVHATILNLATSGPPLQAARRWRG